MENKKSATTNLEGRQGQVQEEHLRGRGGGGGKVTVHRKLMQIPRTSQQQKLQNDI
jgi:hypothetical protein